MTQGVQKVINYIKIKEVTQGKNENPALFGGGGETHRGL